MRYFFHVADGARDPDQRGMELPNDECAKAETVRYAGLLLQAEPHALWEHGQLRVEVTDEHGILRWLVMSMAVDAPDPDDLKAPEDTL